jgi:hypothetical protein
MMDTVVDIYELSTGTKKTYNLTQELVRAFILPATNESIAMYDNMPQGQSYEFRIMSDSIPNLRQQTKLVVHYSQMSDFTDGDTFVTVADTKRTRIMGKYYLTGMCYKAE